MDEIRKRMVDTQVAGAMVCRAAFNHPCSFVEVDRTLWGQKNYMQARRKALLNYLFMGEPGNEAFQRCLRKLVSRADRYFATSQKLQKYQLPPSIRSLATDALLDRNKSS